MYADINGTHYALDGIITQGAVKLIFSDTPIEDVDALAVDMPGKLCIYSSGEMIYEFDGYTKAVELRKNPSNSQVLLTLERGD